MKVGFSVPL